MAAAPVSRSEVEFTLQALRRENIRIDGRALSAYRRFGLRFGAAHGEVEVNFGPTRAIATCSGEVITPPPERPNEGKIQFHVEFGPIASPNFEVGRPSVQANTVANFIERLLKGSHAIDTEALCIVGGQKVWSIRVDVRALDDDGNLNDVCCIAALCSLMHFRKADVTVHGDGAQIHAAEDRVPVPLSIHHLPVPVTFALFATTGGKDFEPSWLLDPNRLEEAAMGGQLTVAVNQHGEICGMHKPGGMAVDIVLINQCLTIATARAKELCSRIQGDLEADLAKRQAKRKNVHMSYAKESILSVDWATPTAKEAAAPPLDALSSAEGAEAAARRVANARLLAQTERRARTRARALAAAEMAKPLAQPQQTPLSSQPLTQGQQSPSPDVDMSAPVETSTPPEPYELTTAQVDEAITAAQEAAIAAEALGVSAEGDLAAELRAVEAEAAELEAQLALAQTQSEGQGQPPTIKRKKKKRKVVVAAS